MRQTIINRIATSQYVLPVSLVIALALWLARWDVNLSWLSPMAILTVYMVMEMNNRHALVRVRSRVMSALFVLGLPVIMRADMSTESLLRGSAALVLMLFATVMLFVTYDRREPVVPVFHCFIALGLTAVACPPLVVCIPVFWLYLIIYMRAWSARVCVASLLGLLLVAAGTTLCLVLTHTQPDALLPEWQWPSLADYHVDASWLIPSVLGLVAVCHYIRQCYDDKIQVRMMNYVLVQQWFLLQALQLLVPADRDVLAPTAWFCTVPLVAHQMAVSRSHWTTAWFAIVLLTILLLLLYGN